MGTSVGSPLALMAGQHLSYFHHCLGNHLSSPFVTHLPWAPTQRRGTKDRKTEQQGGMRDLRRTREGSEEEGKGGKGPEVR